MNKEKISTELDNDEKIIWSGGPGRRIFTKNEIIRNPVSFLVIFGFLVYYIFFAAIDDTLLITTLLIAAVFIVYNVVIKTVIKTVRRNKTIYALTDKHILFLLTANKKERQKSVHLSLNEIKDSTIVKNRDGTGSIVFSLSAEFDLYPIKTGANWGTYPNSVAPVFFDITDPESVKQQFDELKQALPVKTKNKSEVSEKPFNKYDD